MNGDETARFNHDDQHIRNTYVQKILPWAIMIKIDNTFAGNRAVVCSRWLHAITMFTILIYDTLFYHHPLSNNHYGLIVNYLVRLHRNLNVYKSMDVYMGWRIHTRN